VKAKTIEITPAIVGADKTKEMTSARVFARSSPKFNPLKKDI